MTQTAKQLIDVGQIGNSSTGDILYDGGEKVNGVINSVYSAFGDQRLESLNNGVDSMVLHATGYYQKATAQTFRLPIELGTMWDVDATGGSVSPILPKGKRGECVRFINTNGSLSVNNPLVIQPQSGNSFVGLSGVLTVSTPYTIVECICISDGAVSIWNYNIKSLFGEEQKIIDTINIIGTINTVIPIVHVSQYTAFKLNLVAVGANGASRSSEVNILVDNINKKVYSTEFAVLYTSNEDLIDFSFSINAQNIITMIVKSTGANTRLSIKSTDVQRVGSST